ncbi:MAG TPA: hypothetical protein ENI17_06470 [Pseudomonas xinjiangensis]|uniref:Uncharacterized protein n=2 Tax=root TaxID=1 RepID=A0A7V1BSE5_9GAMM|nr:hypothetical protein [Halopseudomonas xinjiangensis]HEC47256.1 hypothetical protein [Halopseudomonas xinjiangensis]
MAGKFKSVLAVFTLITMGMGYIYAADGEPTYSRQECIQKVIFDWDDRTPAEAEEVINSVAKVLRGEWKKGAREDVQIPDFAFPFANRNEWYLQYREGCDQKKSKTAHLIENIFVPAVARMPNYVITDEKVIPSPRTIAVTGESWKKDDYE